MNETMTSLKVQSQLKNPAMGMVLAFVFGCLGLMYSDVKMGLIMLLPTIAAGILCITFVGLIIGVPALFAINAFNAYWAHRSCTQHNLKIFESIEQKENQKAA